MGCMSSKEEGALAVVIHDKEHWNKIKKRFIYGKSKYEAKQRDKLWDLIDLDRSGSLTYAEVERGAIRELELEKLLTRKQLTPILVRAFNAAKIKRKEKVESVFGVSSRPSMASEIGTSGIELKLGEATRTDSSTNQLDVFGVGPSNKQSDLTSFRKGILKSNNNSQQQHKPISNEHSTVSPPHISQHLEQPVLASPKLATSTLDISSNSGTSQQLNTSNANLTNNTGHSMSEGGAHKSPNNGSTRISFAKSALKVDAFGEDLEDHEAAMIHEDGANNPLTVPRISPTAGDENKEILNRNSASNSSPILRRKQPSGGGEAHRTVSESKEQHNDTSLSVSRTTSTASKRKIGSTSVGKLNLSAVQKEKLHQLQREEFRLFLMYIADYMELFFAFQSVDSSGDNKVSLEEFTGAVPLLRDWGVAIDDPVATFQSIDVSGDGTLTFKEFSEWAIEQHMQVA